MVADPREEMEARSLASSSSRSSCWDETEGELAGRSTHHGSTIRSTGSPGSWSLIADSRFTFQSSRLALHACTSGTNSSLPIPKTATISAAVKFGKVEKGLSRFSKSLSMSL